MMPIDQKRFFRKQPRRTYTSMEQKAAKGIMEIIFTAKGSLRL